MHKVALGTLPVPSTSFTADAIFEHPGGDCVLRFEFLRNNTRMLGGIRYERVRAYRFRAEGHCTPWHVEDVYDTLSEVSESDWVKELLQAEPSETWGKWKIRHFIIFIDGDGCYEVAAGSWSWLPVEVVGA